MMKEKIHLSANIINADDFGLNSSVNKAVIEAFEKGLINSTTLLANMPGFEEAIALANKYELNNQIGVHLNLTEGIPLTEGIKSLHYLFNKTGNSPSLRLKNLFFINKHDQKLIFKEYSAQIDKVRSNGIRITHIDTHHQLHDMWSITNILLALLQTYKIPSMRILNNLEKSGQIYKNIYRDIINRYLISKRVNFTEFLGDRKDFLAVISNKPDLIRNKKVEIMVHPFYNLNGKLIDKNGEKEFDLDIII